MYRRVMSSPSSLVAAAGRLDADQLIATAPYNREEVKISDEDDLGLIFGGEAAKGRGRAAHIVEKGPSMVSATYLRGFDTY